MKTRERPVLLDQFGKPMRASSKGPTTEASIQQVIDARQEMQHVRQQFYKLMKAKYDAAQTVAGNVNHWSLADNLDPHAAAALHVRRTLRNRSRYEVIENNPYLKGTILTIANDFVGKAGPSLQVIDKKWSPEQRKVLETSWWKWSQVCQFRQKLWRMRIAKIVDGESFLRAYRNENRRKQYEVQLDFQVLEADRISSDATPSVPRTYNEIDGVRFDNYENPISYFILNSHPGGNNFINAQLDPLNGSWTPVKFVVHWFRQDRGWLRGIPETAPSLPLCAILRRYSLAVVRNAEVTADVTVLIESETPPGVNSWNMVDDPFDSFPIEMGMIMNLPYGYKANQLKSVPLGVQYDAFVGSILREITRPLLAPFHIVAGTSKDSNMASAVVDQHIYKGGQQHERIHCEESVIEPVTDLWFEEAKRIEGHLKGIPRQLLDEMPEHRWRWDRIGLEHTDPAKVAQSLQIMHDKRFLTDRDVQEEYLNRDVEDWREEIEEDDEFRKGLEDSGMTVQPKQEDRQAKVQEKQLDKSNKSAEKIAKDRNKVAIKKGSTSKTKKSSARARSTDRLTISRKSSRASDLLPPKKKVPALNGHRFKHLTN